MVNSAVDQLKAALKAAEAKLVDLRKTEAEVEGLRIAIAVMQGDPVPQVGKRTDFQDFGVTAAAKKFLREAGEPQDTRTIAEALIERGLKTTSKNFIATVYATLRNGKMFKRTKDNRWQLLEGD